MRRIERRRHGIHSSVGSLMLLVIGVYAVWPQVGLCLCRDCPGGILNRRACTDAGDQPAACEAEPASSSCCCSKKKEATSEETVASDGCRCCKEKQGGGSCRCFEPVVQAAIISDSFHPQTFAKSAHATPMAVLPVCSSLAFLRPPASFFDADLTPYGVAVRLHLLLSVLLN